MVKGRRATITTWNHRTHCQSVARARQRATRPSSVSLEPRLGACSCFRWPGGREPGKTFGIPCRRWHHSRLEPRRHASIAITSDVHGHLVGTIAQKAVDGAASLIAQSVHIIKGGRLIRGSSSAARKLPQGNDCPGAMAQ